MPLIDEFIEIEKKDKFIKTELKKIKAEMQAGIFNYDTEINLLEELIDSEINLRLRDKYVKLYYFVEILKKHRQEAI